MKSRKNGFSSERLIIGVFVIAIAALVLMSVLFFYGGGKKPVVNTVRKTVIPTQSPKETSYPTIPKASDMSVMVNDRRFNPITVTISHGNRISFQNISDKPMTLQGADARSAMLNIGPIASGDEIVVRFPDAGVYTYKNPENPKEIGTVVVK